MAERAYIVKHMRGRIEDVVDRCLEDRPYALSDKKMVKRFEVEQPLVFVVESYRVMNEQRYRLGYCFRAHRAEEREGGALWEGGYTYRVIGEKDGDFRYAKPPARVADPSTVEWLRFNARGTGIAEIPDEVMQSLLERLPT